jgi:hypothetical protein
VANELDSEVLYTVLVSQTMAAADPFSLQNLLPAGTLTLPISRDHAYSAEGWHTFVGKALLPHLTDQDETLCRHLDFLVEHEFLSIECKIGDSGTALILRIYLVPYDLPGVQGKLRVRDESSVLKPARTCLGNVLPQIVQEKCLWDAHDLDSLSNTPCYFLDSKVVSIPFFKVSFKNLISTTLFRTTVLWQRSTVTFPPHH